MLDDVIVWLLLLFFIILNELCLEDFKWELGVDGWLWGIEIFFVKCFLMWFNVNILLDGVFLDYGLDINCFGEGWEYLDIDLELMLFLELFELWLSEWVFVILGIEGVEGIEILWWRGLGFGVLL